MSKLTCYWHTLKYLRWEQIIFRITNKMRMHCSLGVKAHPVADGGAVSLLPDLDVDPVFLQRFPVDELLQDNLTILHGTEQMCWNGDWFFKNRSPLWNYNLHYCEYLLPLVNAWKETKQQCYLKKIEEIIDGWIAQNPRHRGGCGWDAYPVSLRLINWINCYGYLEKDLKEDLKRAMLRSMAEQYVHLSMNLEKHLLGNHYFENLKTLVICGLFFRDTKMAEAALRELKKQCTEQILPDGMHFELSPMYHKLILEDLFRVCAWLRQADRRDPEMEAYLQPMVDASYSLEEGLERIPLFNDCGNNVTKSLAALLLTAKRQFGIVPQYQSFFPDSGYYIFKNGDWKLIVDAGRPGPDYLPGHAHCDAMSFELFHKGRPVLVNCGTYAYQCAERNFFRSTAAHNTVMREGVEQSQCWGNFRMAKRAKVEVVNVDGSSVEMEMTDYEGHLIRRKIHMDRTGIYIEDACEEKNIHTYIHVAAEIAQTDATHWTVAGGLASICFTEAAKCVMMPYAEEFGEKRDIPVLAANGLGKTVCRILFEGTRSV